MLQIRTSIILTTYDFKTYFSLKNEDQSKKRAQRFRKQSSVLKYPKEREP